MANKVEEELKKHADVLGETWRRLSDIALIGESMDISFISSGSSYLLDVNVLRWSSRLKFLYGVNKAQIAPFLGENKIVFPVSFKCMVKVFSQINDEIFYW